MALYRDIESRWRNPVLPFLIRRDFSRPAASLVKSLSAFPVADVSDVVGRMYTMHGITSLYRPAPALCGPAATVKCPPGDNIALTKALGFTKPGDVLVVDAQGFTDWCLGGVQIIEAAVRDRGLAGFVVNGAYRDIKEIQAAGFAIYGKGIAPWSGPKMGPGEINVPVCCGGVVVHPGDLVTAGEDGVVVVPLASVEAVAEVLAKKAARAAARPEPAVGGARPIWGYIAALDEHIEERFTAGKGRFLDDG